MTDLRPQDDRDIDMLAERDPIQAPEIIQPVDGFKTQLTTSEKKRGGKVALAIAGAAAALGGAIVALTGGGGNDPQLYPNDPLPHAETPDAPGVIAAPIHEAPVTPSTDPEVIKTPVIEPELITANDTEGILSQFDHNLSCFYNNRDSAAQQKCLQYIMGDGDSDLTSLFNERLGNVVSYRATHPEFDVEQSFANTKSRFYPDEVSPSRVIIVTEITDGAGTSKARYTFVKQTVTKQQFDVLDKDITVWMLYREEGLEPGEVDFAQ